MKPLVIGADPFPPFQFINADGIVWGTDYETITSIIDKMGHESKFIINEWPVVEEMFNKKELDIVFQVQKTPKREGMWFFSNKLRDAVTSIITSTDNTDYTSIDQIFEGDLKLGVIGNYQYGEIIDSIESENKVYFNSLYELVESINNGNTKFGVIDLGVFNYINKDNVYENVKIMDNLNFNRPLYVAFNDEKLRDEFNIYLS